MLLGLCTGDCEWFGVCVCVCVCVLSVFYLQQEEHSITVLLVLIYFQLLIHNISEEERGTGAGDVGWGVGGALVNLRAPVI